MCLVESTVSFLGHCSLLFNGMLDLRAVMTPSDIILMQLCLVGVKTKSCREMTKKHLFFTNNICFIELYFRLKE